MKNVTLQTMGQHQILFVMFCNMISKNGVPKTSIPVRHRKGIISRNAHLTLTATLTLTLIPVELFSDIFAMASLCDGGHLPKFVP